MFDKYENGRINDENTETSLNADTNNFEIPILENNTYPSAINTNRYKF